MLLSLLPLEGYWTQVKDGNPIVAQLYMRHYSCYQYADKRRQQYGNPSRFLVMGPGEKLILLSLDGLAIFGWRKFIDDSGQQGVNCSFFRNESPVLSSVLILDAERHARAKWGGATAIHLRQSGSRRQSQSRLLLSDGRLAQMRSNEGRIVDF